MQRRIGPNRVGQRNLIRFYQINRFYHGSSINNNSNNNNSNNNSNNKYPALIVYHNVDTNKSQILSDNRGKAVIYLWTHLESGKIYVGSSSIYTIIELFQ